MADTQGKWVHTQTAQREKRNNGVILTIRYKQEEGIAEQNGDFIARVLDGMISASRQLGYDLVMRSATGETLEGEILHINASGAQGVIFLGTEFDETKCALLDHIQIPLMVVDNPMMYKKYDCVVMDNAEGAYSAISTLYQLGHRQIGHLKSAVFIPNFAQRDMGVAQAVKDYSLNMNKEHVFFLTPTAEGAFHDMCQILEKNDDMPSALFADNDIIAIGAIRALKKFGFRVPRDISVIGFDDISHCTVTDPTLSTVHIYKQRIGRLGVEKLVEKIKNPCVEKFKLLVGTKIILRESTARYTGNP